MAAKKAKKDFDKERMYAKIMPSVFMEPKASPPVEMLEDLEEEWTELPEQAEESGEVEEVPQPEYVLRNYMEDIVLEKFAHTIKMLKGCTCEKCKKDVMAYTLNALPPSYMAIKPDDVDDSVRNLRAGVEVKVSSALIKAVQHVKANPQHSL